MNFAFDLDEVIVEFLDSFYKFYKKTNHRQFSKEQLGKHLWNAVWNGKGVDTQIITDFYNSPDFEKVKPVKGAIKAIKKLSLKNKIIVITSRPKTFNKRTKLWLNKHLKNISLKLIHTRENFQTPKKNKSEICKTNKAKIILEDSPVYALDCAKAGIKVILFTKTWNTSLIHKNVKRVKDWKEALIEINKITKP